MATYKRIAIDKIKVDDRYQRPVDASRVKRMATKYDEALVGTLEVSQRNGTGSYVVFDGQHRLEAAKIVGVTALPCLIHKGLTPEEEAELFVALQRQRKNISPLDRFRARLFLGEEIAVGINATVQECGYRIADTKDPGRYDAIGAVVAVERIYMRGNLTETLTLLRSLWAGDAKSTDGALMEGLSLVEFGYANRLTDERLERLRAVPPVVILRRAVGPMRGGSSGPLVASEIRKAAKIMGAPSKAKVGQ
jgi:hypothetical protein